jgi:chemotaxis response regulator CheB
MRGSVLEMKPRKNASGTPRTHAPKPFSIVGIGASAGGLEAFSDLLHQLPEKTGMAFVLVQHLDPKHSSELRDILSRTTKIPVTEVSDGTAVKPDHVYVIPPGTSMTIKDGVLRLAARALTHGQLHWRRIGATARLESSCQVRLRMVPKGHVPSRQPAGLHLLRMKSRQNTRACRIAQ